MLKEKLLHFTEKVKTASGKCSKAVNFERNRASQELLTAHLRIENLQYVDGTNCFVKNSPRAFLHDNNFWMR